MELIENKEAVAGFMRRLYKNGLTTTSGGNISLRCDDTILITPSALDKGRMVGDDIGVMDMCGNIIGKPFKPTVESRMHLSIYLKRPDVKAVVHAHPVNAGIFAVVDATLRTDLIAESYVVLGNIGYVDYFRQGSEALAEAVSAVAASHNCLIMKNHGALTVGESLLQAFDRLEVMEAAARTNLIVRQVFGGRGEALSPAALRELDLLVGRNLAK